MSSRVSRLLLLAALPLLAGVAAYADSFTGSTVSGSFAAVNDHVSVTQPFGGPTLVGSATEFSGSVVVFSNPDYTFDITANFFDNGLDVNVTRRTSNGVVNPAGNLIQLAFSDAAFQAPFVLESYTCTGCSFASGLTSNTLNGNTLTLNFSNLAAQTYHFTATASAAAVTPEPSSIALLATGLLGMIVVARKRFA